MKILAFCIAMLILYNCNKSKHNTIKTEQQIAINIAQTEWLKAYGSNINNNKPFLSKKINDSIWIIEGTLHQDMGGVPYAEVNIKTRKTIKITHGK
ncbi:hypothetical protein HZQ24_16025 [Elizabethkingia anophelis]|uniref:YbbC/YhhH family protein n=1 Tax=Elizabethkingia anophelis TaxID=1117645 RepID=UPI0021A47CCF|nr:hypothetical protein [Elizabethkingia anophelis]MDV3897441.1 hypothetical protein [Elizabethkingia anophelis]